MQKSAVFLYMNHEQSESKIIKTIWCSWKASKRIKFSEINFMKQVKDLYNGNYKTLLKEITEDIINRNISHVHELGDLIKLNFQYFSK